jgi:hypothetical protein
MEPPRAEFEVWTEPQWGGGSAYGIRGWCRARNIARLGQTARDGWDEVQRESPCPGQTGAKTDGFVGPETVRRSTEPIPERFGA